MHAERIGDAESDGVLVRRAALGHERGIGGVAGQPFVLPDDASRPLRVEEIFYLPAGTVRIKAAASRIGAQLAQEVGCN